MNKQKEYEKVKVKFIGHLKTCKKCNEEIFKYCSDEWFRVAKRFYELLGDKGVE